MSIHLLIKKLDHADAARLKRANQLLSADEAARAKKYIFDKDRIHFILGRACLRTVLAEYLNIRPETIQFAYTASGKPYIEHTKTGFSVSHSNGIYAVAISTNGTNIGLDIERITNPPDLQNMISGACTEREVAFLSTCDTNRKRDMFFKLWTAKEAFLKAKGDGLIASPKSIEILPNPSDAKPTFRLCYNNTLLENWSLTHIRILKPAESIIALVTDTPLPPEIIQKDGAEL